jgi:Putative zinc-finger
MKCEDIKYLISVAGDDLLDDNEREMLDRHLSVCPLCRQERDDIRNLVRDLKMMHRPAIPAATMHSLRNALAEKAAAGVRSFWLAEDMRPWTTWLMPSSVGMLASVLFAFVFLWTIFLGPVEKPASNVALANQGRSTGRYLSEASRSYAGQRQDVSNESPSLNPEGALVALTNSLVRGDMKDSEVVVVADVFGNGLAKIDEVVEPSRDRRAVDELDRALRSDPAYAPFVPADLDQRPESMKVILKIQNVSVSTRIRAKHR